MFYEIFVITVTICVGIVTYFKWSFTFWKRKGVPYIEPQIPFGNSQNPIVPKVPSYEILKRHYNYFKSKGCKHGGIYVSTNPVYVPIDVDLIKAVMTKDFAHFVDRGVYFDEKHDPLSAHLFSLEGQKWRNLRSKLTPTFTSGKMKIMFQNLLDCGGQMTEHIDQLDSQNEALDMKDVLVAFTTDVIGSCAFGLDINSFKEPDSEFRKHTRGIFVSNLYRKVRLFFILLLPKVARLAGMPIFQRSITDFFMNVVKDMVKYREENNVQRNDFMKILLELKNTKDSETGVSGLTVEEIAAQAFVFFLAGFETSSTAMNFCLFELARNQEIQDKVRNEIKKVVDENDGKLSYEGVMEMKYLGQVIDETLRKYPPVPSLMRKCVRDYVIPDTDITIEKGTRLFISVMGLHHDSEYYQNPEVFDPERFSDENRAKIPHFAFLPFGEGPRNCIGLRFGLMQTRVGLALILKNYKLTLSPKTKLPIEMNPNAFLLQTKEKIYLDTEKIGT